LGYGWELLGALDVLDALDALDAPVSGGPGRSRTWTMGIGDLGEAALTSACQSSPDSPGLSFQRSMASEPPKRGCQCCFGSVCF